jgi:DHA3 family tetracycline resistance protein-like MFS transporter
MWEIIVLTAVYGTGTAFFTPAFEAVVPELLPADDLPAANSMDQFVRPIALRLLGPALGGWIIASVGSSFAFAFDAATFGFSTLTVVSIAPLPRPTTDHLSLIDDVRGGLQFIRHRVWIWGTLISAAVAYLLFLGPTEVLLPYVVKDGLHGSASTLGLVFASGGVGAIGSAIVMGQRGQPKRPITVIYVTWTAATLAIAGYGLATASWQLMLTCLAFNVFETAGTIVWATLKQRHVPANLLSRVSSLDWLISIALLPVSLALTAPVAGYLGARLTLILAGALGAAVTLAALFLPGMRDLDVDDIGPPRDESAPEVVVTRVVLGARASHSAAHDQLDSAATRRQHR